MIRFTYECGCGERRTESFDWAADSPERMKCPVCGAEMVRQQPKPAVHYHPTKRRKGAK